MYSSETVAIRFPKAVWKEVRVRAMLRGETGLAWLSRCAELCLRTAGGEGVIPGVTAGMVEPPRGSDVARRAPVERGGADGTVHARTGRLQAEIDRRQGGERRADAARGREGEDDQRRRPEEEA